MATDPLKVSPANSGDESGPLPGVNRSVALMGLAGLIFTRAGSRVGGVPVAGVAGLVVAPGTGSMQIPLEKVSGSRRDPSENRRVALDSVKEATSFKFSPVS